MIKNMRCPDCGCRRKKSHEKITQSRDQASGTAGCEPLPRHPENRNPFRMGFLKIHEPARVQSAV